MNYITLFLEFFKIGLFSVGGGLATLPFLQKLIPKYGWITEEQLLNLVAVAESTPGPIGINAATFIGYQVAGLPGGVIASLGMVSPSIIITVLVARWLKALSGNSVIEGAFNTIRPAVAGLIAAVAIDLGKSELIRLEYVMAQGVPDMFNFKAIILFVVALALLSRVKVHPVFFIVGAAVIGILFRF